MAGAGRMDGFIRELLNKIGLYVADFPFQMGIQQQNFHTWLRENTPLFTLVPQLAAALNIPLDKLFHPEGAAP